MFVFSLFFKLVLCNESAGAVGGWVCRSSMILGVVFPNCAPSLSSLLLRLRGLLLLHTRQKLGTPILVRFL